MEWMIAGAALFFFTCLVAWAFSLYSKQVIAGRRKPDNLRTRRRNLKGKPTQKPTQQRKGKLPSGYTPVQPIYPPASTPPEPPQSPAPPQPVVEAQPTPPAPPAPPKLPPSPPPPKGKLPSGYKPVQPIYPPASTPPEPPKSPEPSQPVVEVQPTTPTPSPQPAKLTPWQLAGTNYRKILTFVDQKTADRLLKSTSYKYPDKSEAWIVDKVLWDLQRDKFRG